MLAAMEDGLLCVFFLFLLQCDGMSFDYNIPVLEFLRPEFFHVTMTSVPVQAIGRPNNTKKMGLVKRMVTCQMFMKVLFLSSMFCWWNNLWPGPEVILLDRLLNAIMNANII